MSQTHHIAVLPGDGIGPEIMAQAYKVKVVTSAAEACKIDNQ